MHDLRMALPAVGAWATAAVVVGTDSTVACGFALAGLGATGLLSQRRRRAWVVIALLTTIAVTGVGAVSAWRMTAIARSPVHDLARGRRVVGK